MDQMETRKLIEKVERSLDRCEAPSSSDVERGELRKAWTALVAHLALGPAPELRNCPHCNGSIMRAATRCVHCWTKSRDPAESAG